MPPRRLSPLLWLSLALLLLYAWTWTESATLRLRAGSGVCTAELYGRSATIPCPGLTGGTLVAVSGKAGAPLGMGRGPLARLAPGSAWTGLALRDGDGNPLPTAAELPPRFTLDATLRRPNEPAALVLLPPGSAEGWAFVPDGQTRRGVWWTWRDGEIVGPMDGVPFDKPLVAQAQSFLRLLLGGWQGALVAVVVAWVVGLFGFWVWGRLRWVERYDEQAAGMDMRPGWQAQWLSEDDEQAAERHIEPSGEVRWWLPQITMRNFSTGSKISSIPNRLNRPLLILATLFVFAVSLHVSIDVLERIPHVQDSVTYLFQAQTLARGRLSAPAPPLADADRSRHFDQEFLLVRDGRWFGKYPPGYPALLAAGVLAGAHWLVNPLLAALTVPLLLALTRELYRREGRTAAAVGPLALVLLASSPFFLIMSGSLMAHPAELLWAMLFMLTWARAIRTGQSRSAIAAGLALGALFLTRQFTALTVGLSFGAGWAAVAYWQRTGVDFRSPRIRAHVSSTTRQLAVLVLAALPFVLALFAYQAAVTGDPFADPRLLYWSYDRVGFGPGAGESQNVFTFVVTSAGPAQQWSTDPGQPPRGNTPSLGLYNLGRNFTALEESLFAWPPLLTLAFVWLAFLLRRPAAADWVLLLMAAAIAAGYVFYWAAGIAYGPRYFYAALPALVILTARGALALAATVSRKGAALLVLALLVVGLVSLPARMDGYREYNFVSGAHRVEVEAAVDTPALVFVTASRADWWEYGAFFSGNTPWLDGDVVYARDLGAAENERLEDQFPDRAIYLWRNGRLIPLQR